MTTITIVPLDKLEIDPANVRKTDTAPDAHMLASLKTKGLIEPLIVRKNGKSDHYLVTDGGKRLRGLQTLAKAGDVAADLPVSVVVRDDDEKQAIDTSLVTAVVREEIHPVDEYEAFAALNRDGMSAGDIAKRYGIKERTVLQALALGGLAPVIRKAWREGKIRPDAAQAFTLQPDHAEQEKLYKSLNKSNGLWANSIRGKIIGDRDGDDVLLSLVTRKGYEEAGGKITEDLFGDDVFVSDPVLLKSLADEKLKAKCDKYLAEGWGWAGAVEPYGDIPREAQWSWGPFKDLKNGARKNAGVIIAFEHDGKLKVLLGATKPEQRKREERAKASAAGKPEKKKPELSGAITLRLSEQLTKAAALAMQDVDHRIAAATLLAGFNTSSLHRGPCCVVDSGLQSPHGVGGSFAKRFAESSKLKGDKLLEALAVIAGRALDFRAGATAAIKSPDVKALCDALGKSLIAQAQRVWDAKDYFASVPKALCLKAITEAVNADEAKKIAGKPKSEIAKFASANVPKTGWLPPELRNASYAFKSKKANGQRRAFTRRCSITTTTLWRVK